MSPKIDLLIPIYNGRSYLDSLFADLAKTRGYFSRILFYDDASADGSADYLEQHGFEVIRGRANVGPAEARNKLVAASSGEFIHFHDADDPLLESFLEKMTAQLDPAKVAVGRFVSHYPKNTVEYHPPPSLKTGALTILDAYQYTIHLNSVVFPRRILESVGGFQSSLRLHEDRFLFLSLAIARVGWSYCPETFAIQLHHARPSASSVGQKVFRINWIRYFEQAFKLLPVTELGFLAEDLFNTSCDLIKDGEHDMAKRGFILCEKLGLDRFPQIQPKMRLLIQKAGFYRSFYLQRLLRRRLVLT